MPKKGNIYGPGPKTGAFLPDIKRQLGMGGVLPDLPLNQVKNLLLGIDIRANLAHSGQSVKQLVFLGRRI